MGFWIDLGDSITGKPRQELAAEQLQAQIDALEAQSELELAQLAAKSTPEAIKARQQQFYLIMGIIDKKKLMGKKEFKKNILGITNNENFKKYFECFISFYERKKYDINYPEVEEKVKYIEMTKEYYEQYRQLENFHIYKTVEKNPWKFLTGLRMAMNNMKNVKNNPKIQYAINLIISLYKSNRKIIIYSSWINKGIDLIKSKLNKNEIPFLIISGNTKKLDRYEYVRQFNDDKYKVLLISRAGGEGLDLKGVRDIIILDKGWNRESEKQIIGRGIRYKSHDHLSLKDRNVTIYYILLVKPKWWIYRYSSADIMLDNIIKKKEIKNNIFKRKILLISIEKYNCIDHMIDNAYIIWELRKLDMLQKYNETFNGTYWNMISNVSSEIYGAYKKTILNPAGNISMKVMDKMLSHF